MLQRRARLDARHIELVDIDDTHYVIQRTNLMLCCKADAYIYRITQKYLLPRKNNELGRVIRREVYISIQHLQIIYLCCSLA